MLSVTAFALTDDQLVRLTEGGVILLLAVAAFVKAWLMGRSADVLRGVGTRRRQTDQLVAQNEQIIALLREQRATSPSIVEQLPEQLPQPPPQPRPADPPRPPRRIDVG